VRPLRRRKNRGCRGNSTDASSDKEEGAEEERRGRERTVFMVRKNLMKKVTMG